MLNVKQNLNLIPAPMEQNSSVPQMIVDRNVIIDMQSSMMKAELLKTRAMLSSALNSVDKSLEEFDIAVVIKTRKKRGPNKPKAPKA